MIKIYNAENTIEAQYLCSELQNAGIAAYSQESASGEYLKITSGINQVFGTDLFVNDEDASKAKQLIQEALREKQEALPEKNQTQDRKAPKIPWYKNRTIMARVILVWAIIMIVVIGIFSL